MFRPNQTYELTDVGHRRCGREGCLNERGIVRLRIDGAAFVGAKAAEAGRNKSPYCRSVHGYPTTIIAVVAQNSRMSPTSATTSGISAGWAIHGGASGAVT